MPSTPHRSPMTYPLTVVLSLSLIGTAAWIALAPDVRAAVSMQNEDPKPAKTMKEKLLELYDLSDPRIDIEQLLAPGVWQDGIPPLTDPERVSVSSATYPAPSGRVIEAVINGHAVAYPLGILNFHEIANDTVGGQPIAATYCPLCDSASLISRTLEVDGKPMTLEFGVSGFLYNSNVVMWEKSTNALWSQVLMQAVTGPHAGRSVEHYPVRVISFSEFKAKHPKGEVLTTNTGHDRRYEKNPYKDYFDDPDRLFGDFKFTDDRLPHKALGIGIVVGGQSYFIPHADALKHPVTFQTVGGLVEISADEAGMRVERAPSDAKSIQTFFHSWAAFHPGTEIVTSED